jgi:hypothetical protein
VKSTRTANLGDFFDTASLRGAVDLSYFVARPENAFAVERRILGMIQTVRVSIKVLNGNLYFGAPFSTLGHRQLRQ